jgi:mannose-1-phosphate guanylyltransferase / phosphomannomutase
MQAAIIAGGFGTRAASMTADRIPKALLPVGGVPIIFRQMRVLRREGVKHITVLGGHRGDLLRSALESEAMNLGLELRIVIEQVPLGTAGCLAAVDPGLEDTFIVYGDMLFDIALAPLREFHKKQKAVLTIVAHPNDHPRTSDLIVEEAGWVEEILRYRGPRDGDHRNLVPAGLYLASSAFFSHVTPGMKMEMIGELLPKLVSAGLRIGAYNTPEYLRDVGSPTRHALAERDLAAGLVEASNKHHRRGAVFFDCDGVLNEEPGRRGAVTADDVKAIPGAGVAVRRAREGGRLAVAVTNRPQVAKGFVTLVELTHILGKLEAELAADGGVLDRIYYCPHHPEAGFAGEIPALKVRCECRKPGTLLLKRAISELPIDQRRSVFIGDSLRDIGAAHNFGIWGYGVRTGAGCRDGARYQQETGKSSPMPDLMFENVGEAVAFDLEYQALAAPIVSSIKGFLAGATGVPVFVGVCGRSRSGKTVAAHAIVRALSEDGIACLRVRLDDWIVPEAERDANSSPLSRNRVETMPGMLEALRAGSIVRAPGYDAATRGPGRPVIYDPAGHSVVVLEGCFASHQSIRPMLDLAIFATAPETLLRSRFRAFYQWKGLDERAIDLLWRERAANEWPAVDVQRSDVNFVMTLGASD